MSTTPVANTYVAGEDPSRLKDAAAYLGLNRARLPTAQVREAVGSLFSDTTLEAARMVRTFYLKEPTVMYTICYFLVHCLCHFLTLYTFLVFIMSYVNSTPSEPWLVMNVLTRVERST